MTNTISPNELYAREPKEVLGAKFDNYDYIWWGSYFNHVPEIDQYAEYESTDRIQVKIYQDFDFDGRRFWRLASIWYEMQTDAFTFEHLPVMIIRNAGREGDDFSDRFITNPEAYKQMVAHINTLKKFDKAELDDCVDPAEPVDSLLEFYGNSLDGHFERYNF